MSTKKKLLTAASLTAMLTAGGVGAAMFGAPTPSSAETRQEAGVERADSPDNSRGRPGQIEPAPRRANAGDERPASGEGYSARHPRGVAVEAAAEALGMTPQQLKAEMRAGKSVRTVAEERNVAVQTVIDAIVEAITEHAEARAAEFVERERPAAE